MAKGKPATGKSARGARSRRGKGEAFTEAKANAVEVRTATGALPLPSPDKAEYHRKQILGYKEQAETAQNRYRNSLKSAQKDGIDTDSLLDANKYKRENDPKKRRRKLEQLAMFLQMEGYPIHIMVSDVAVGNTLASAEQRGYDDAKASRHANNDYPENSDLSKRYLRGFNKGTAENAGMSADDIAKLLADYDAEHGITADESGDDEAGGVEPEAGESGASEIWDQKATETTQHAAGNA